MLGRLPPDLEGGPRPTAHPRKRRLFGLAQTKVFAGGDRRQVHMLSIDSSGGILIATLAVTEMGNGAPVAFVQGGFSRAAKTFAAQRSLQSHYRLRFVDRRGYGESPETKRSDPDVDAKDICDTLLEPTHLVAFCYGGLGCLIAAGHCVEQIRSLTLIEPPTFSLVRGAPAVEMLVGKLSGVYAAARQVPARQCYEAFFGALGINPPPLKFSQDDIQSIQTTLAEKPPWEISVPLRVLAKATFPKVIVRGEWEGAPGKGGETAAQAFNDAGEALGRGLNAQTIVIKGATHNPQIQGPPFNERLKAFLHAADQRKFGGKSGHNASA